MARKRGWGTESIGGVHLHHEVVGIVLMLAAGLAAVMPTGPTQSCVTLARSIFGVGAALVLDEFALVFYLRDVYWSREGRDSVDAAILAVTLLFVALVLTEPFGLADPVAGHRSRCVVFLIYASNVTFTAITFLKAKPFAGIAAVARAEARVRDGLRAASGATSFALSAGDLSLFRPTRTTARAAGGRAGRGARGPVAAL